MATSTTAKHAGSSQDVGDHIRTMRKLKGLTLSDVGQRTGMAVSTLSKLEKGHLSLSYDKLMMLSKALGVEMAELLDTTVAAGGQEQGTRGRRIVHRAGDGQLVETRSYSQLYLAGELLRKRFTPIIAELHAATMQEFLAEFGGLIRHPGEEFAIVLEGEVEFCSELYAPVRLKVGDSIYFDSDMGHAYLKASGETCRVLAVCAPRGTDDSMMETFVNASVKLGAGSDKAGRARAAKSSRGTRATK